MQLCNKIMQLQNMNYCPKMVKNTLKIKKISKKSAKCIAKIENKVYYNVKDNCRALGVRRGIC